MMSLLFYTYLGHFVISCATFLVSAIWYHKVISEVLARNRDRLNLQIPRWPYASWGQIEMIRFAEKVDMNLAKRLKQLRLVLCIAGVGAIGSFFLTAFIGRFVWKN